jgi:signal transduction histidine kinase
MLDNAISHNVAQGDVRVEVGTEAGQATLAVVNTGPLVPADEVDRLLQPFQRMGADRLSQGDGVGLGLSIVAAVANAHDARLQVQPGTDGGLRVEVRFASAPGGGPAEPDLALNSQT